MENTAKKTKEQIPSITIKRVVKAKREKVFQAWTKPELMNQWFHPIGGKADVTNDLRVGGSYRNEMAGCSSDDAKVHTGEYLEITPSEKLVFTWNSPFVSDSRVTVELADLGDSTEVKITHELLETEELRTGHSGGWNKCLDSLVNYLG